ncbi:hypothetical protein PR003_g13962 [Phytophthora rubi]|uniref:Uncharacterized protein n=1 Tax=Phytophthora rubi TaxID=129364 RepID=A0A6A3LQB5_9STRA|nr:hypothetical protein PR001_g13357 [Phytophthora rubi]KAE9333565.1 hypothetical protein PR003_g13962 [Phytophthora rubi]
MAASYCYSYLIPDDLVISLQADLDYFRTSKEAERQRNKGSPGVVDLTCTPDSTDDATLAVWVTPELDPFSSVCVCYEYLLQNKTKLHAVDTRCGLASAGLDKGYWSPC